MKKIIPIILIIVLIFSLSTIFIACKNDGKVKEMSYDKDSSIGLFFYGDEHVLGHDDVVRASKDVDTSYFDPAKPTIIWVHGWESSYGEDDYDLTVHKDTKNNLNAQDENFVELYKEAGYNVASFQYQNKDKAKNFAKDLGKIFEFAYFDFNSTGKSMAYLFASELCMVLGDSYDKDIIYVGHSCGSFVTLAINNMVKYFLDAKIISNKHLLASQMLLADPYIQDLGSAKTYDGKKIFGTGEDMGSRTKAVLCRDLIKKLYENNGVITQIYLGMDMASAGFKNPDKYSITIDMGGFKKGGYGATSGLHCITRDWVLYSIVSGKLSDSEGKLAPSGAISVEEAKQFIGKKYTQTLSQMAVESDIVNFVADAK